MNTETIETLTRTAETITSKAEGFEITIVPQNRLHAWLMRKGWRPAKKQYELKPIVIGNLFRISKLLLTVDPGKIFTGGNMLENSHRLVVEHTDTLIDILAIAIKNTQAEPDKGLKKLIRENLTAKEILTLLSMTLRQLDLQNFISSIISIRGLNVLETEEINSPWEMIGGVIKYFRFDFEFCLWNISYANLNMLLATIPTYETDSPGKDGAQKVDSFEDMQDIFNS